MVCGTPPSRIREMVGPSNSGFRPARNSVGPTIPYLHWRARTVPPAPVGPPRPVHLERRRSLAGPGRPPALAARGGAGRRRRPPAGARSVLPHRGLEPPAGAPDGGDPGRGPAPAGGGGPGSAGD